MQSKTQSFIEATLNTLSGFVVAFLMWTYVVTPVWEIDTDFVQNVSITATFTVVSIIRSYLWRRYFNGRIVNALS